MAPSREAAGSRADDRDDYGAVVMVEGIFVVLDHRAKETGMEQYNKLSKLGMIKQACMVNGKGILFAKLIIITGLLPIFSFQKVEGKMFSPLAWTLTKTCPMPSDAANSSFPPPTGIVAITCFATGSTTVTSLPLWLTE